MPYVSKAQARKFHADPKLRKYAPEFDAATDFSTLAERAPKKPKAEKKRTYRRTVQGRFA